MKLYYVGERLDVEKYVAMYPETRTAKVLQSMN